MTAKTPDVARTNGLRHPPPLPVALAVCAAALAVTAGAAQGALPSGPTVRDSYDVFTIGDSYASGEGAPDVDGVYNDNGDVIDGQFEDWDSRFGGSPAVAGLNQDSTRCHRSGHTSTSAVATEALQAQFPDVLVAWTSVACGGASIVQTAKYKADVPANKGGVLRPYDGAEKMGKRGIGADKLVPAVYPAQLAQINDRFSGRVDAMVMNLGGNDAGFAELITQCLNIVPAGDCNTDADLAKFVSDRLALLNDRFDRLALALRSTPRAGSGDPDLRFAPNDVFLTKAPNPLRPTTATSLCDRTPAGNYEENLKATESQWLVDNVVNPLNARFATEATQHGWHIVDAHVNRFFGHAICSPAPANWINTNLQALRKQGELDETIGLPIAVSGGIVHPNRDGFAAVGAELLARMRPIFVDRYTPDSAPATTPTALATGFSVRVDDAQLAPLASGYWHRIRVRQLNADGTVVNLPAAPDGLRELPYGTTNANYARTGRYFVVARACGPLSRNGTIGCGPASAQLPVSTFVPARPVELTAVDGAAAELSLPSPTIAVRWKHASALSAHDTRSSIVRLVSGKTVIQRVVPGPFTSTRVSGLTEGASYSISVRACNDGNRCSTTLGPVVKTATAGESSLGEGDLQAIEIALEGLPCSTAPVLFDPELSAPEDPTPTFQPSCPGEPSVGRLRLARRVVGARAGRPATVELRWRHPSRWHSLHEVFVEIVGRRGVLATLRFDQNADRLTLTRGTARRGGRSLPAGKAGRLAVRGVSVRLARDAIRGSGLTGADVRMRFGVVLGPAAGRRAGIRVGASDDTGQRQPAIPAGEIRVR